MVQYVFAQHSGCAQFLWFERANEDKNLKFEEKDKERALCDNMDMVEHRLKELVKLGPKPIRFLRGNQETDWAVVPFLVDTDSGLMLRYAQAIGQRIRAEFATCVWEGVDAASLARRT